MGVLVLRVGVWKLRLEKKGHKVKLLNVYLNALDF